MFGFVSGLQPAILTTSHHRGSDPHGPLLFCTPHHIVQLFWALSGDDLGCSPFARFETANPSFHLCPTTSASQAHRGAMKTTEGPQVVASPNGTHTGGKGDAVVEVNSLHFSFPGSDPVIKDFTLNLPKGSRCLLAGANGSGKTTVLQVLAGQYMVPEDQIRILGKAPFSDLQLSCTGNLTFMGSTWRRSVGSAGYDLPLQGDISAETMIFGVENVDPARRDMLLKLLDVDLSWKMHSVSDGQRRRVQICLGLLKPFQVLLLDEITVDMDVIGRMDLLKFLEEECEMRGATIVYATHIFDGIEPWLTHVAYMEDGQLQKCGKIETVMSQEEMGKKLLYVVEEWLRTWRNAKRAEGKREKSERIQKPIMSTPYFPSKHMAFYR